jgi:TRAP-type C4-dicarboxylate transport system permease small subunit
MVSGVQRARLFVEKIFIGLSLLGFVTVLLMMLWNTIDVVLWGFGSFIPATVPWTEVLNVIAVMLPLAYATFKKSHISIDLITSRLPAGAKRVMDLIVMVMMFLFMALFSWRLSMQAWRSVKMWEFDHIFIKIYYFPAKIALALAFIMAALVMLFQIIDRCHNWSHQ